MIDTKKLKSEACELFFQKQYAKHESTSLAELFDAGWDAGYCFAKDYADSLEKRIDALEAENRRLQRCMDSFVRGNRLGRPGRLNPSINKDGG